MGKVAGGGDSGSMEQWMQAITRTLQRESSGESSESDDDSSEDEVMKALIKDRLNSQKQKAKDEASQKPKKKPDEGPGPVLEGNEDLVGMVASYQNGTLNMDRLYSEKQKKPSSFKGHEI